MLLKRDRSVLLIVIAVVACSSQGTGNVWQQHLPQSNGRYYDGREARSMFTSGVNGGVQCATCTVLVALSEQLAEIHNQTIIHGLQRVCTLLPEVLKQTCDIFFDVAEPVLVEMAIDGLLTPDVTCHILGFCWGYGQDTPRGYPRAPGIDPTCYLFPLPKPPAAGLRGVVEKTRNKLIAARNRGIRSGSDPCANLPIFKELCEVIKKKVVEKHLPLIDDDLDDFSTVDIARGSFWRGKDCDDANAYFRPGAKPSDNDEFVDSNCNGIYGIDPEHKKPFEETLCSQTQHMGLAVLGDSLGAHFHIPKEWFTAAEINKEAFKEVTLISGNELDWPMTSLYSGYMNSTWPVLKGMTDSIYFRLWQLNRCIHRDFQNIAVNGADSHSMNQSIQHGLSRDQHRDYPLLVFYSLVANDVCNSENKTIARMTTMEEMRQNFLSTLAHLDAKVPNGSHVIAMGLLDLGMLYDVIEARLHPLGEWWGDVTYGDVYAFLSCLGISPCNGWGTPNATLRNITSQRAANLSLTLQNEAATYKATNFKLHYIDLNATVHRAFKMWEQRGGETWQLFESVDGFNFNQFAMPLLTTAIWDEMEKIMPDIIKSWTNPNNERIKEIFGDQGGY